jgi:hypothetical protein
MSTGRKVCRGALIVTVNLVLIELVCVPLAFKMVDLLPGAHLETLIARRKRRLQRRYLRDAARWFDPELGWDVKAGERKRSRDIAGGRWSAHYDRHGRRRNLVKGGHASVATFGDSFVHGSEVNDHETWQSELEDLIEADVHNYGVPGYGLFQTILKLERIGRRDGLPKVTIIGVYEDALDRSVNSWRGIFHRYRALGFKPHCRAPEGSVACYPNPVRSLSGIRKRFAREVRTAVEHDYWVENVFVEARFPYSFQVLALMHTLAVRRASPSDLFSFDNWGEREIRQLADHLIDRTQRVIRGHKSIPVLLFFPQVSRRRDRGRGTQFAGYISSLRKRLPELLVLDVADIQFDPNTFTIKPYKGHISRAGNRIVAKYLAAELEPLLTH